MFNGKDAKTIKPPVRLQPFFRLWKPKRSCFAVKGFIAVARLVVTARHDQAMLNQSSVIPVGSTIWLIPPQKHTYHPANNDAELISPTLFKRFSPSFVLWTFFLSPRILPREIEVLGIMLFEKVRKALGLNLCSRCLLGAGAI